MHEMGEEKRRRAVLYGHEMDVRGKGKGEEETEFNVFVAEIRMFKASFIMFFVFFLEKCSVEFSEAKSNSATRIYDNTIITIMIILTGRKAKDG